MVFPYFTVGRSYVVLGVEGDWLRLLNDDGEPVLLPQERVVVVDPSVSVFFLRDEEGGIGPGMFLVPGFFEGWHDGDARFRRLFDLQYALLLAEDIERNGPLNP